MKTMDIGQAVRALEEGKRVARSGWNGKGMYLQIIPGGALNLGDDLLPVSPCIGLKTAGGNMQPGWNASTPDLFALDWTIVE